MKLLLLPSLVLIFAAAAFAQDRPVPARRIPVPVNQPTSEPLTKNVTVKWKGSFQGMVELDFESTGVGPRFMSEFPTKKSDPDDPLPPTIFSISTTLAESEGGYTVEYKVGARLAIPSSRSPRPGGGLTTNIEYRDLMVTGTALVAPGEPLAITKVDGKELTLEVTEAK